MDKAKWGQDPGWEVGTAEEGSAEGEMETMILEQQQKS